MTIFQYKIIVFQGRFSIISAFSINDSINSWNIYSNWQYVSPARASVQSERGITSNFKIIGHFSIQKTYFSIEKSKKLTIRYRFHLRIVTLCWRRAALQRLLLKLVPDRV